MLTLKFHIKAVALRAGMVRQRQLYMYLRDILICCVRLTTP